LKREEGKHGLFADGEQPAHGYFFYAIAYPLLSVAEP